MYSVDEKVVYNCRMKGLDFGTIGIIVSYYKANENNNEDWVTIYYEQNLKSGKVVYQSARISEILDYFVFDYIQERMKGFAQNIDDFKINQIVYRGQKEYKIVGKTRNSIEIDDGRFLCWYDMDKFNKTFTKEDGIKMNIMSKNAGYQYQRLVQLQSYDGLNKFQLKEVKIIEQLLEKYKKEYNIDVQSR